MCVLRRRDGLSQPSSFFFLMALLRGQCAEATLPSEPPRPLPFLPRRKINMQGATPLARVNINTPGTGSRVGTGSAAHSGGEGGNYSSSANSSSNMSSVGGGSGVVVVVGVWKSHYGLYVNPP